MLTNKKIATAIIKAQVASDAAKGIYTIRYSGSVNMSYAGKDEYIRTAIRTIIKKQGTGCEFYVTKDVEGIAKYLVYFQYRLADGIMRQVSFHSFDVAFLKKYEKKGGKHKMEWDRLNSRLNCMELNELIEQNII